MNIHRISFNMNHKITVVLRERGVQMYNQYYQRLGLEPPQKLEAGQEFTEQMWCIMRYFAGGFENGFNPPIETQFELHTTPSTAP